MAKSVCSGNPWEGRLSHELEPSVRSEWRVEPHLCSEGAHLLCWAPCLAVNVQNIFNVKNLAP